MVKYTLKKLWWEHIKILKVFLVIFQHYYERVTPSAQNYAVKEALNYLMFSFKLPLIIGIKKLIPFPLH